MIQRIEENETKEKKQIEEYEKRLQSEQQSSNVQSALFETLKSTGNNTKLLQLKQELVDYTNRTLKDLIALKPPTTTDYHIEELDQLQTLTENILQYGHFVEVPEHSNPQLVECIGNNQTNSMLYLSHQSLNAQDMKIVTDVLRNNQVRIGCIFFFCINRCRISVNNKFCFMKLT